MNPDEPLEQQESLPLLCRATLANTRKVGQTKKEYSAPLTSFDWNPKDPSLCVTSSIDTTCTIWDVNTQQAKTQLIAHDKEVYDVAFTEGVHVFSSVGADGSVRMFDLRSLEHSTIIYETCSDENKGQKPLLRLSWNKQDPNYLATFEQDSKSVIVLDVRVPAVPVTELHGHDASISSISWAPHSSSHLCSTGYDVNVGDDGQALIWDLSKMTKNKHLYDPLLAYGCEAEIHHLSWNQKDTDWIALSHGSKVEMLSLKA